ncbi:hypothetical protein Tco_0959508, partial [Tanacetum coccineum]
MSMVLLTQSALTSTIKRVQNTPMQTPKISSDRRVNISARLRRKIGRNNSNILPLRSSTQVPNVHRLTADRSKCAFPCRQIGKTSKGRHAELLRDIKEVTKPHPRKSTQ